MSCVMSAEFLQSCPFYGRSKGSSEFKGLRPGMARKNVTNRAALSGKGSEEIESHASDGEGAHIRVL